MRLSNLEIRLDNIKNVRSPDRVYPSQVYVRGTIFDHGRLAVDGRANFLAEPQPAVAGRVEIGQMEIDYLKPIARKYNVMLNQGTLSLLRDFEYAPKVKTAVLENVTLRGVRIDYIHTPSVAPTERVATQKAIEATKKTADHPEITFRIDRLDILDTTVGYVNKAAKQDYRVLRLDLREPNVRLEQSITEACTKFGKVISVKLHRSPTVFACR